MKYPGIKLLTLSFLSLTAFSSSADDSESLYAHPVELVAPGYGDLTFKAPEAGSYKLPVLDPAQDATVLDTNGNPVNYHELFKGKYTVFNFMYSRCNDVNGCPLSHLVFNRIKSEAKKYPGLADHMQLISMSFDPSHDTPEVLKELAGGAHDDHHGDGHAHHDHGHHDMPVEKEVDWHYLTADSEKTLMPILDDYGQSIQNQINEDGSQSENFSHILRVYLIDPELKIRNIYSVAFLHPDIILNDVRTLLIEDGIGEFQATKVAQQSQATEKLNVRVGPSDNKDNYESDEYITNSLSVYTRKGQKTDLLKFVKNPPLGLPEVPVPADNPITAEKIELGKQLFFDRRLSLNNTISCAMCHIPEQGFTNNEIETSIGFEGRSVKRNAPTIYNTAYYTSLFHDGRETSLETQVWQPITARNEMAMPSIGQAVKKIRGLAEYKGKFEAAFGGKQADIVTVGQALASYQRALVSGNSDFDRWYYGKEKNAISESAQRGFELFRGKAQCIACHSVNEDFALFTDNQLHNTGLGWNISMKKEPDHERVLVAPGHYMNIRKSIRDAVGLPPEGDLGHYEVTQDPADRWRYRTPSLRNVALTAPYMHDGSLNTLRDVIEFYNHGGFENETQSPLMNKLNLNEKEVDDLIAFMKTLTGDNAAEIIADAFTAPIGDTAHNLND
jgi:cytochrome c peroxidase